MNLNLYKNIYFLGIGGVSMSSLALILKKRGFNVAGYDEARGSEVELLEKSGVTVCRTVDQIDLTCFDAVVFTAALHETHPAMIKAAASGKPVFSRAKLLGAIAEGYTHSVGIAGTHGKSTSCGMLSSICEHDGDSTYIVGAVLPFIGSAYKLGSDDRLVFEACEYCDSFLEFHPSLAVVLNVKLDHTDYFKDEAAITKSFCKYISGSKTALINSDDPNALYAAKQSGVTFHTFSVNGSADFSAIYDKNAQGFPQFDVYEKGVYAAHIALAVPGMHNIYNALAAYSAARLMGISPETAVKGLADFHGVKRRFELCEGFAGVSSFYADYAHHPDEVKATLTAARGITNGRLIAVFQPHTYSRLKSFFNEFADALSLADKIIVTDVYAARETDDGTISGEMLADAVNGAEYNGNFETIASELLADAKKGDTVMILGAGDIVHLADILKNYVKKS